MSSTVKNPDPKHATEVLSSWKEIAAYLNRGVRTVQRWESVLRMPVHRPARKSRSAVMAFRSELELWLKDDGVAHEVGPSMVVEALSRRDKAFEDLRRSVERCETLRAEMRINLQGFNQAVKQYGDAVRSLKIGRHAINAKSEAHCAGV